MSAKYPNRLTLREQAFVEAFKGNATLAALECGYRRSSAAKIGSRMMKKQAVRDAIRKRDQERPPPAVADRLERQSFWTHILRDEERDLRDRLKASELLGKSSGDFLERVEHSGMIVQVVDPYAVMVTQAKPVTEDEDDAEVEE